MGSWSRVLPAPRIFGEPAPLIAEAIILLRMMSPSSTATVRVLLFASYADWTGRESVELSLATPATVADVVQHLRAAVPWGIASPSVRLPQ